MWSKSLKLQKTHDFLKTKMPRFVVVFVHGVASDSSIFNNTLRYLEGTTSLREIRFVTFDLLGSGKSPTNDRLNYDYKEQIEALHNAILKLKETAPLILVGHSLGALIVAKYAQVYKKTVFKLILVSPPIYTPKDLDDPAFKVGLRAFKDAVSLKKRSILKDKAFNSSMDKIVLDKNNYQSLIDLKTQTIIVYGGADELIKPSNIPKLLKANPNMSAIKTIGRHGMSHDKYNKIREILEEALNAENL